MKCNWTVKLAALGAIVFSVAKTASAQAQYSYTTVDFPGAAATRAYGINNVGQIVGEYIAQDGKGHGFLYSGGAFTTINYPGALSTTPSGINNSGQITGYFVFPGVGYFHGFLDSGGTFTMLDAPGASLGTVAYGLNDRGQIVGTYFDVVGAHGFLFSSAGFTSIDYPGTPGNTQVIGINDRGDIVGNSGANGFLFTDKSSFTTINYPGASFTFPRGINSRGQISGNSIIQVPPSMTVQSFVLSKGSFAKIDDPNGVHETLALQINDRGQIVGIFVDGAGREHGFLASPVPD